MLSRNLIGSKSTLITYRFKEYCSRAHVLKSDAESIKKRNAEEAAWAAIQLKAKKSGKKVEKPMSTEHNIVLRIPDGNLQIEKMLGSGQYGEVWEGIWGRQGTAGEIQQVKVAVKMLKPGLMANSDFLTEAEVMKLCKGHRNVLQHYATFDAFEPLWIAMELMGNGSLLDYVKLRAMRMPMLTLVRNTLFFPFLPATPFLLTQAASFTAHLFVNLSYRWRKCK